MDRSSLKRQLFGDDFSSSSGDSDFGSSDKEAYHPQSDGKDTKTYSVLKRDLGPNFEQYSSHTLRMRFRRLAGQAAAYKHFKPYAKLMVKKFGLEAVKSHWLYKIIVDSHSKRKTGDEASIATVKRAARAELAKVAKRKKELKLAPDGAGSSAGADTCEATCKKEFNATLDQLLAGGVDEPRATVVNLLTMVPPSRGFLKPMMAQLRRYGETGAHFRSASDALCMARTCYGKMRDRSPTLEPVAAAKFSAACSFLEACLLELSGDQVQEQGSDPPGASSA